MQELYINFHNLIKIWAPELSHEVHSGLKGLLGRFFVEEKPDFQNLDIMILPLASARLKYSLGSVAPSPYGMSFVEHHGENGIVFNYRGKPDLVLMLGQGVTIYFSPRRKNLNRMYGLVLFSISLVIGKKGGLLFHGAAVRKDDFTLLLAGLRGSKKTLLLLSLLHEGWDFVSDDKMLLHNKSLHMFQDLIPLKDHHVQELSWLFEQLPAKAKRNKSLLRRRIRKKIAAGSRRLLSKNLLPLMERVYDPYYMVKTQELFSSCEIVNSTKVGTVVIVTLGDKIACTEIDPAVAQPEISAIQSLRFYSMGPLEQLVFFCKKDFQPDIGGIIKDNLDENRFFRLTIPGQYDTEEVIPTLVECIR